VIVMVIRPEGLFPSAARRAELHAVDEEPEALEASEACP